MRITTKYSVKIKKALRVLGPGLITGASDDDPSGIATYSQAGAGFGFSMLWTALLTFPLMAAIQGMCARIGIVTQEGLTVALKKYYSKPLLYLVLFFSLPAITLNIGADIQAMGAVAHMLLPQIPVSIFSIVITAILIVVIIKYPYYKIANILKWLCLTLMLYIIVPFMVNQDWSRVLKSTFVPSFQFNMDFLSIFVAILGTTISPYLFFWQTTMEAENMAHKKGKIIVNKRILSDMRKDVNFGMLFSNVVMFFIILTTGSVLYTGGVKNIDTVEEAAKAMEPLAGRLTYVIFALGVLGTGMLAIPVLAGAQSYMLAETLGWRQGLDKKFNEAKGFYLTIVISLLIGLSLDIIGISPIQALLYTAILYGLTAPVLIAIVMHISNNKKIMGEFTNNKVSNIFGGITLLLMSLAALALLYLKFTNQK